MSWCSVFVFIELVLQVTAISTGCGPQMKPGSRVWVYVCKSGSHRGRTLQVIARRNTRKKNPQRALITRKVPPPPKEPPPHRKYPYTPEERVLLMLERDLPTPVLAMQEESWRKVGEGYNTLPRPSFKADAYTDYGEVPLDEAFQILPKQTVGICIMTSSKGE